MNEASNGQIPRKTHHRMFKLRATFGIPDTWRKVKVKVGFLYSAAYAMTGPARCTISEVAVDWQEPMVLQHKLRPSNCTR